MTSAVRILGIDPGSRVTGYGLVELQNTRTAYITSGCIATGNADLPARLAQIFSGVQALVAQYQPTEIAVEQVFVNRNANSALKLGQARGAAICATVGSDAELFEYAARAVKQAIVGRGGADKQQVQHMVRALLSLSALPQPDEADALAVALCHAHQRTTRKLAMAAAAR